MGVKGDRWEREVSENKAASLNSFFIFQILTFSIKKLKNENKNVYKTHLIPKTEKINESKPLSNRAIVKQ